MSVAQLLNETYKLWKAEPEGVKREDLQILLVKLLEKLALAICWKRIPDLRGEFSWVANEAIWRAISGESKFGGKSQFSVWFYRIVVNECHRILKRSIQAKERSVSLESPGVLDAISRDGDSSGLDGTIRTLGWEDSVLVRLKIEGWSTREIAAELGATEAAIKMRWSRLKGRLRDGQ